MDLIKWEDPFASIGSLHRQIDDMFNSVFAIPRSGSQLNLPAMDIYTEGKDLVAEVQAPGFSKDDVDVSVHNGILEIKGEHKEKEDGKDKKRSYMMRESSATFYRRIALPKGADENKVQAEFEDGMLKVRVPLKELPGPKKIQITAGKGKSN